MQVAHELLEMLCCPATNSPLRVMKPQEVQELNTTIAQGRASYAGGARVTEALMEHLREGKAVAIFPTLGELRDDFLQGFEEMACEFPDYEDGERCPTLLFRRKPRFGSNARS